MGYSPKWLKDNLGITRYMIQYYEDKHLLPKNEESKVHDYSDEDIERIWCIKLLIEIGFSTDEIYEFANNPNYDFDTAIAEKVEKLEQECQEKTLYLQFAKTIKLTGRIPAVKKVGSMKSKDFIDFARENWNCYNDPQVAPFAEAMDKLTSKKQEELNYNDVVDIVEQFDKTKFFYTGALYGYLNIIANMKNLDIHDEVIQKVVDLIYKHVLDNSIEPENRDKFTPKKFAKYIAPSFIAGDVAVSQEQTYGKESCLFIAEAIACYGGLQVEDL